jgi:hypothetical protein
VEAELRHQDAIIAYFDSAGREVAAFLCPDFESFIADTSLMYRDVLFITDLPRYVIPAGSIRVLKANSYIALPHYDWLPDPPDLSSSSHPPAPRVCPGLLHLSTPAPFYHVTTLSLDFVQTQTELTPPRNTTIPALPSGTSIWRGIWPVTVVVMGGCPH